MSSKFQWILLIVIVAYIIHKKSGKHPIARTIQTRVRKGKNFAKKVMNRSTVGCKFNSGGTLSTGVPETMCAPCTGAVRKRPGKGRNVRGFGIPKHFLFPVAPSLPVPLAIQSRKNRGR